MTLFEPLFIISDDIVAAAPSVKIAVVTLSETGNANFGIEVVKMAGNCGQVDILSLIGQ